MCCLRLALPCALFACLILVIGCSSPKLIPVEGKVTVGNQPLKSGTVTYHPDTEGGNTGKYADLPNGPVDESGKYSLSTGGKAGAPPGKYKVTVRSTTPSDPKDPYSLPKHLIDQVNAEPNTTTIKKEVKADASAGNYDIPLSK